MIQSVLTWFKQPLVAGGSPLNWILLVGVLIVAAGLWNMVLLTIKETV